MKGLVIVILVLWQCCGGASLIYASDADILWSRAVSMARDGQIDLAFSNFNLISNTYPHFKKASNVCFALGEYYFQQEIFPLAAEEFEKFYTQYPKQKEALIALAFLYKMAKTQGNSEAAKKYQKEIISSHQLALIFKRSKSFQYLSGYRHRYKVIFYIDKIEVFSDGTLFITIPS